MRIHAYSILRSLTDVKSGGLLPQLNCRQCGERTCVAFAVGLLLGQRRLDECPRGDEPAYAEAANRLRALLPGPAPWS